MPNYFKVSLTYNKQVPGIKAGDQETKSVTEFYLIDAVSYTDAEARAVALMVEAGQQDFTKRIDPYKVGDVIVADDNSDEWYRSSLEYTTEHEKTGKEKKVVTSMLLNAVSIRHAMERTYQETAKWLLSVDVVKVERTKFLEVIHYTSE